MCLYHGVFPLRSPMEDKALIDKILTHLDDKTPGVQTAPLSQVRAPPAPGMSSRFDKQNS